MLKEIVFPMDYGQASPQVVQVLLLVLSNQPIENSEFLLLKL